MLGVLVLGVLVPVVLLVLVLEMHLHRIRNPAFLVGMRLQGQSRFRWA